MEFIRCDFGDVTVLELNGQLTLGESSQHFKAEMQKLLLEGRVKFVLVYKNVPYMDSAGGEAMVQAFVIARNAGGEAVFASVSSIRSFLQLTRLEKVFKIFPNVSDALAYFGVSEKNL